MSIEVRSLVKNYPDFSVDIGLSVGSNETLVLAGPSGCGKTTALQMIAGLVLPDSGLVIVDGHTVNDLPAWKRGIGIVFQDLALFPHLSVGGNVGYGPLIAGISRAKRQQIITESLAAVRLDGYEPRRVDTLSGGERQRVAIARALAAKPKALLMDEPFSSLDAPLRRALRTEFRELRTREGFPCIFVTHDREEAAAVADRIAVMNAGRVVECGSPAQLFNEPKTAFTAHFLGSGTIVPILSRRTYSAGVCAVRCLLGEAELPYDISDNHSLLVPPDAVMITTVDSERAYAHARVTAVSFEGNANTIALDAGTIKGTLRLSATIGRRAIPPNIGETVGLHINWDLVRTVRDSIE
ncbi:MAG: ABC transporter ATP-binding protein [Treponemataceae bacterium]